MSVYDGQFLISVIFHSCQLYAGLITIRSMTIRKQKTTYTQKGKTTPAVFNAQHSFFTLFMLDWLWSRGEKYFLTLYYPPRCACAVTICGLRNYSLSHALRVIAKTHLKFMRQSMSLKSLFSCKTLINWNRVELYCTESDVFVALKIGNR